MRFIDRADAGRRLASRVASLGLQRPTVLGLPRGGVIVAAPVAEALDAPLDVVVASRLRFAGQPDFCVGAVAEGLTEPVPGVDSRQLSERCWRRLIDEARTKVDQRVTPYRAGRELPPLAGADVVLVDDGLVAPVTMEAAVRALRHREPRRVVLAVPVCGHEISERLGPLVDDLVCNVTLGHFGAVQFWYENFRRVTDDEVLAALAGAPRAAAS